MNDNFVTWNPLSASSSKETVDRRDQRHALAVELCQLGIFEWHLPTQKMYFSPEFETMLGYSSSELTHHESTLYSLIHPDDSIPANIAFNSCAVGVNETFELEFRLKHKLGHWIWVLSRGKVSARKASGEEEYLLAVNVDISHEREARLLLSQSEKQFRCAFDASPIGIMLLSTKGQCLKVNPMLCQLLEYSQYEMLSLSSDMITYADDVGQEVGAIQAMLDGKQQVHRFKKRFLTKHGSVFWAAVAYSLVWEDGEPLYFVCQVNKIDKKVEPLESDVSG